MSISIVHPITNSYNFCPIVHCVEIVFPMLGKGSPPPRPPLTSYQDADQTFSPKWRCKNAGHHMAIVAEPYNNDAHAKIPALFKSMLCQRLWKLSSVVCASSMYSRLCLKMSSFLFLRAWTMPRIIYLSCGIPFPVWALGIISGLMSVVVWLSWWEVVK